jgi:carbon storage regulator
MLVLSRKVDERIVIDDGRIRIAILGVQRGRVRLGITAAPEIPVLRAETLDEDEGAPLEARGLELGCAVSV